MGPLLLPMVLQAQEPHARSVAYLRNCIWDTHLCEGSWSITKKDSIGTDQAVVTTGSMIIGPFELFPGPATLTSGTIDRVDTVTSLLLSFQLERYKDYWSQPRPGDRHVRICSIDSSGLLFTDLTCGTRVCEGIALRDASNSFLLGARMDPICTQVVISLNKVDRLIRKLRRSSSDIDIEGCHIVLREQDAKATTSKRIQYSERAYGALDRFIGRQSRRSNGSCTD
jgi:hypothetical protein